VAEPEPPILEIRDLSKEFPVLGAFGRVKARLKAVDGVSFALPRGEVLGLVGESGCGKSTLGKTIMGIHEPSAGEVLFQGRRIAGGGVQRDNAMRARVQYAYQDPGASLDPRWKLRDSLHEPLIVHTDWSREKRDAHVREIVRLVGLPETHLDLYPHEISGGQQRRVGLARILTLRPEVVVLDEPTSGLDVSVQATVLTLFRDLQRQFGLTYILVSHDLAVVQTMCDRVAVMYLGRIVELADKRTLFRQPLHPYTEALLSAAPIPDPARKRRRVVLQGDVPSPANPPPGCRFHTRCPYAVARCRSEDPPLREVAPGQHVACHLRDVGAAPGPLAAAGA
jgi:peptide/nickel transport system ATP-binding protein/oligopeptide transport system ATP-binding protein